MAVKSQVSNKGGINTYAEWTKTYEAMISINDTFSGQVLKENKLFYEIPSKMTVTHAGQIKKSRIKIYQPYGTDYASFELTLSSAWKYLLLL